MRAPLLVSLLVLAGCGSAATVGSFDPREPAPVERGSSLLVVPVGAAASTGGGWLNAAMGVQGFDTEGVAAFVPLDSLGAESYTDYAVGAIVDVIRESGAWGTVAVGALPEGVEVTEESYRVTRFSAARSKSVPMRTPVRAIAAGSADAFGPGVDYVLFVYEPGMGFLDGRSLGTVQLGQFYVGGRDDNAIALRSEVVLWDDQAGTVVTMGEVGGAAPIKSRVFSAASERAPSALVAAMREDLAESIRREVPVLIGE